MFKVLCLVFLVPCAALVFEQHNSSVPKSASPEGVELLWHRPNGPVKGILLYLHGCHGRATGMFHSNGTDGFHFNVCDTTKKGKCMGYVEEVMLRQKARKRGYVAVAISGGIGNPRGCMNTNDVPRIQLAMKHLIEKEEPDLANKPVIMVGHSSGGRVLPELITTGASIKNAKCIVPTADEIRVRGDSAAPLGPTAGYPEDVSAFFVHMEKDDSREKNIKKNIAQLQKRGVRVGELKLQSQEFTEATLEAEGYGFEKADSAEIMQALKEYELAPGQPLISKNTHLLLKNPYGSGDNWQTALSKRKYDQLLQKVGGLGFMQQMMDVAWSEHWMAAGRNLDQILEFCEQPGSERKHEPGQKDFDLLAKVQDINWKANNWKKQLEKKTAGGLKKNHGAQMKAEVKGKVK